jgi:branched-subunit amino acid transport protein
MIDTISRLWDWIQASGFWEHLTIVLMALITMITRSFFLIPDREIPWPAWASRGLQFAPIAAVSAVIVPEIIMTNGELITSLKDARIYAALAGFGYFVIRRGKGQVVMGTMLSGMAVFLPLRLGFGW